MGNNYSVYWTSVCKMTTLFSTNTSFSESKVIWTKIPARWSVFKNHIKSSGMKLDLHAKTIGALNLMQLYSSCLLWFVERILGKPPPSKCLIPFWVHFCNYTNSFFLFHSLFINVCLPGVCSDHRGQKGACDVPGVELKEVVCVQM